MPLSDDSVAAAHSSMQFGQASFRLQPPLPPDLATEIGRSHAAAILDQSARNFYRALPAWCVATASILPLVRRQRPVSCSPILLVSAAAQTVWACAYACVSGWRTAHRCLKGHPGKQLIIASTAVDRDSNLLAGGHLKLTPVGCYLDGMFAWPRGLSGGSTILRLVLAEADAQNTALLLTALSMPTARWYRRHGFRFVVGPYLMYRPAPIT